MKLFLPIAVLLFHSTGFCIFRTDEYRKHLITPGVNFDGSSLTLPKGSLYQFDKSKESDSDPDKQGATASLKNDLGTSYIFWNREKPVTETVTSITEMNLAKRNGGAFGVGEAQTTAIYDDGKLRSKTSCDTGIVSLKAGIKEKNITMVCVTATRQACDSLMFEVNKKLMKDPKFLEKAKTMNQCAELSVDYADLGNAFALTQNDTTRERVVKSDMAHIQKAANASAPGQLWGSSINLVNETDPDTLRSKTDSNLKNGALSMQTVSKALEMCSQFGDDFRPAPGVQVGPKVTAPKAKGASGTN